MYKIKFKDSTSLDILYHYPNGDNNTQVEFATRGQTYDKMQQLFSDISKTSDITVYDDDTLIARFYNLTKIAAWNINPVDNFISVTMQQTQVEEQVVALQQQLKMIDSQVNPVFDTTTATLDEYKNYRQAENKKLLAEFLNDATVEYKIEPYGVSLEDQNEMAMQLFSYQEMKKVRDAEIAQIQEKIDNGELETELPAEELAMMPKPILEWHAKKRACRVFSEEEFLELSYLIKSFVYPYMQKMQTIKQAIFECKTKDEIAAIQISYK